jgi:hypothetical protein
VGVAMFAQWSILSNITSGVILFFSFLLKLVMIKIFLSKAEKDIGAFHVYLKTREGEKSFILIISFYKKEFRY